VLKPGPDTKITIAGHYYAVRFDGAPFSSFNGGGFYDYASLPGQTSHDSTYGVSARIDQGLGFAKLVSITAFGKDREYSDVGPFTATAYLFDGIYQARSNTVTQELQLLSPDKSKLKWIVGGFFMDRTAAYDPAESLGLTFAGFGLAGSATFTKQHTVSYAGFAQATYPVLENTNVTLGMRYTADYQKFKGFGLSFPLGGVPPAVFGNSQIDSRKSDRVTYRVVVDHHFTKNVMAYVSWNTGFKSGYYGLLTSPSSSSAPEYLTSYEGGVKSELFGGRLRLNGAIYHYDITNLQTFFVDQFGVANVLNAGSAKIDGLELEATANPLEGWNIHAGLNWMPRAKYIKYTPCPGPRGILPKTYDCSGSRMAQAPDWDVTLGTDYTLPASVLPRSAGAFTLAVAYHYTSKFPWEADYGPVPGYSTSVLREQAHSLVNIRGEWTSPNEAFSIAAWANNLTGTKYLVNDTQSPGFGVTGLPGAPQTYGVTVGYKF
jgi:iron complex outermembrane receptor protein